MTVFLQCPQLQRQASFINLDMNEKNLFVNQSLTGTFTQEKIIRILCFAAEFV